jgi:hypothetical protein
MPPFQVSRPGPQRESAEELRADAVVPRPAGAEPLEAARLPVGLKTRLDRRAEGEARLPGVEKTGPAGGEPADILLDKKIDGVDGAEHLLAKDRAELDLVRTAERAPAELEEKTAVEPISTAFGKLEDVFQGHLGEFDELAGAGLALLLELELDQPEIGRPVLDLLGEAFFAAVGGVRVVAIVAERLDRDLARLGIGVEDLEIRAGGKRRRGAGQGRREPDAATSRPDRHGGYFTTRWPRAAG